MAQSFYDILKNEIPTIVDFHATWCAPCKMQSPILQELKEDFGDQVKILKVDIDKNPSVAKKYMVRSVPTLIFFKGGEITHRHTGVMNLLQLKEQVQSN